MFGGRGFESIRLRLKILTNILIVDIEIYKIINFIINLNQ